MPWLFAGCVAGSLSKTSSMAGWLELSHGNFEKLAVCAKLTRIFWRQGRRCSFASVRGRLLTDVDAVSTSLIHDGDA